jgi:Mycothiol maleylpyruvate isomerase N-terminal domain
MASSPPATAHPRGASKPAAGMANLGDMSGLLFDAEERAQLSDLLDQLGPEAPTLLAPWTTRDLAAHLVLRERGYLAGPGLVLPGAWGR